jgi:hypothetical protein
MEKTIIAIMLAITLVLTGCSLLSGKDKERADLAVETVEVIDCVAGYVRCLQDTEKYSDDFDRFEAEIDRCIDGLAVCHPVGAGE